MSRDLKRICFYLFSLSEGKMDNLKLNKLLYFIQAWTLVTRGEVAFEENIEAWLYGPVIPEAYYNFNQLKREFGDLKENKEEPNIKEEIDFIYLQFGEKRSGSLIDLTHQYSTWINAWKRRRNQVITPEEINDYHITRFETKGSVF